MKRLKSFLNDGNKVGQILAVSTVIWILILSNITGVFAWFWRTLDNLTSNWVSNPTSFGYGYWYGDSSWGYGYGYGYGYWSYGYWYDQTNGFSDTNKAIDIILSALTNNGWVLPTDYVIPVGSVHITLPSGLIIYGAGVNVNNLDGNIISNDVISGYTNQGTIEFGISWTPITFNKAVKIEIPVSSSLNGSNVTILVSHNGWAYTTNSLATAPTTCTSWLPDNNVWNVVTVSGGIATIYTCSASKFAATTSTSGGSSSSSSSSGGGGGGGSSVILTCTDAKLECRVVAWVYKYYRKSWVSCNWGNLGKSCNIWVTNSTGSTNWNNEENSSWFIDNSNENILNDIKDSFAKSYIEKLIAKWIAKWYADNTFRPQNPSSRAEYLKMVLRAMNIDYSNANTASLSFSDINKNSWEAKVVAKALELKIIDGKNKLFRPTSNVSRAEAMKILMIAWWYGVDEKAISSFSDVSGWAVKYIEKAKGLGIVNGQNVNWKLLFKPTDNITRAEVAKILVK